MAKQISGFSKLKKQEKINWLVQNFFKDSEKAKKILQKYWHKDAKLQALHDDFTENTLSNFYMPYGIAPNFLINGKNYAIPMVIEESSVVAAAAAAAKFWTNKGGFKTEVLATTKIGHVHFMYKGDFEDLEKYFENIKPALLKSTEQITKNMRKRGGGILEIGLKNKTQDLKNYYQIQVLFDTKDSMGANFINSCLEHIAIEFSNSNEKIVIVMSILSNYVPDCLVQASVRCKISDLNIQNMEGEVFAKKMQQAVAIANADIHRATTHNKGIMNGIDAVVIATGNDFRAVAAGIHAYACRYGKYKSLTTCHIENDIFTFAIKIPLALGTVGGLTVLHPMAQFSLELLGNPSAKALMQIIAATGLAQNFAALKALVTTGIQKGHMKMHLMNILNRLKVSEKLKPQIIGHFKNKTVSYSAVKEAILLFENEI